MENNRLQEKENYILIKLDEIEKCFKSTMHQKEFIFKWYKTAFNKTIIAEVEIVMEFENIKHAYYFLPTDSIKQIDKKLKQISKIILI